MLFSMIDAVRMTDADIISASRSRFGIIGQDGANASTGKGGHAALRGQLERQLFMVLIADSRLISPTLLAGPLLYFPALSTPMTRSPFPCSHAQTPPGSAIGPSTTSRRGCLR